MKTLILISILAVSALIVSAAYPKPATIFAPDRSEPLSQEEVKLLANSAAFQRAAVTYIFRKADANKSGNLNVIELRAAYELFTPSYENMYYFEQSFIQNEKDQGDFIKNEVISIDEFAFLFNRWFKFMDNNPGVFTAETWDEMYAVTYKINMNIYYSYGDVFGRICQGFNTDGNSGITFDEYKSGFQKLEDKIGLNFASDDYTMRDSYELMLSPCDTIVSEEMFKKYMVPFLKNYIDRVTQFLPIFEKPEGEEEEAEEEWWEEE